MKLSGDIRNARGNYPYTYKQVDMDRLNRWANKAEHLEALNAELLEALDEERKLTIAHAGEIMTLGITIAELLDALKFALAEYNNMTTTAFSNGRDRYIRDRMEEAIRKAKGE